MTDIKASIKKHYNEVAQGQTSFGSPPAGVSVSVGYQAEDLALIPTEADLGLGCGNPVREAELQPGERVLDLGCAAGADVFLAARLVGEEGYVFGLDMTKGMIDKARMIAEEEGVQNVSFMHGAIEQIPLPEQSIDVVLSNCVINLSQDKARVFAEIYRVLVPGGRLCLSDTLLLDELPQEVRDDPVMHSC